MGLEFKRLKILHALLGIVFLLSGLVVNVFQGLVWVIVKPRSSHYYRKINYYLTYTIWSQVVALAEYWSGSTALVYAENDETLSRFGREHCLCVMNHKFEIDWLNAWMVADKFRCLGSCKSITKKSLKYIPIFGWGWFFGEFIFLHRNWDKDRAIIHRGIDNLMEYDDKIILLMFCEGTRFTAEKHEASMKVAADKGLAPLRHHLLPRTKGFSLVVERMKEVDPDCALYNIQLGFPTGDQHHKPILSNMVKGRPIHGHMYFERIPIRDIPTGSEEEINTFLFDLYQKKDKLMDYYLEHGTFPGKSMILPYRKTPFINWLLWFIPICLFTLSSLWCLLTSHNPYLVSLGVFLVTLGCTMIYIFIRLTRASKGSSYGKISTPRPSSPSDENKTAPGGDQDQESSTRRRKVTSPNGNS